MAFNEVAQWKWKRALEAEGGLLEATGFTAEELQGLFGKMLLVRRFEEAVEQAFRREEVGGYVYLYNGQEAWPPVSWRTGGASPHSALALDTITPVQGEKSGRS